MIAYIPAHPRLSSLKIAAKSYPTVAGFGRVLRAKPGPHNHGKDLEPKTGKQPEMTQEGYRNVVFRAVNRTHVLHPVGGRGGEGQMSQCSAAQCGSTLGLEWPLAEPIP